MVVNLLTAHENDHKKKLSEEITAFLVTEGLVSGNNQCSVALLPARHPVVHVVTNEGASIFAKKLSGDYSVGDAWLDRNSVGSSASTFCNRPKTLLNRNGWLICDFVENVASFKNAPDELLTRDFGEALGRALGGFHGDSAEQYKENGGMTAGADDPQRHICTMLPLTPRAYADTPGLDRDIFIRTSQVCRVGLEELARQLKLICAVHGDLQGGNLMITQKGPAAFHIVDWEFAGIGDPVWDLGHLFASLLRRWVAKVDSSPSSLDSALGASTGEWKYLSSWWSHMQTAYSAASEKRGLPAINMTQVSRVAGHAILQRSKNILYTRGQYTGRDVLLLSVAQQLISQPDRTMHLLVPNKGSKVF